MSRLLLLSTLVAHQQWACLSQSDTRIGIIGAGPSGLFTARELRKSGYSNIEIFEREPLVAKTVQTSFEDGMAHDAGTVLLPQRFFAGDLSSTTMFQPYADIIEDVGAALVPVAVSPASYNFRDPSDPLPFPVEVGAFPPEQIVSEFVTMIALLQPVMSASTIQEVQALGIAAKGETFQEWGAARNLTSVVAIMAPIFDLFGLAPSNTLAMNLVLFNFKHWRLDSLRLVLRAFGVTADQFPGEGLEFVRFVLSEAGGSWSLLRDGQQDLYDKIVAKEVANGATLRLGRTVDHMFSMAEGTKVGVLHSDTQCEDDPNAEGCFGDVEFDLFDVVIVAARPHQALEFLEESHPAYPLYSQVANGEYGYHYFMWDQANLEESPWPFPVGNDAGLLISIPEALSLGTNGPPPACTPYEVSKTNGNTSVFATYAYSLESEVSAECLESTLSVLQQELGFEFGDEDILQTIVPQWPSLVPPEVEAEDWWAAMDAVQGEGNIFFTGEALSGVGIPGVLDHVLATTPSIISKLP